MVGAEKKRHALPCPCGQRLEKLGLQKAVFMMALFRPRIREKHPDFRECDAWWQGIEKFPGFGPHKMAVGKLGAVAFSAALFKSLEPEIDADAEFSRKRAGVAHQKMPVAASDFPYDGSGRRQ